MTVNCHTHKQQLQKWVFLLTLFQMCGAACTMTNGERTIKPKPYGRIAYTNLLQKQCSTFLSKETLTYTFER